MLIHPETGYAWQPAGSSTSSYPPGGRQDLFHGEPGLPRHHHLPSCHHGVVFERRSTRGRPWPGASRSSPSWLRWNWAVGGHA